MNLALVGCPCGWRLPNLPHSQRLTDGRQSDCKRYSYIGFPTAEKYRILRINYNEIQATRFGVGCLCN